MTHPATSQRVCAQAAFNRGVPVRQPGGNPTLQRDEACLDPTFKFRELRLTSGTVPIVLGLTTPVVF